MAESFEKAVSYACENDAQFREEIREWCAMASISQDSTHDNDVRRAAEWGANRLRRAGLAHVALLPSAGNPVIYGESLIAGPKKPTVLVYGHYDVQPALDQSDWESPAFEPVERGEYLYARGASDMKGQVVAVVGAAEAFLKTNGVIPINLKFLIEGEEENGSRNLRQVLRQQRELLACDYCLTNDLAMLSPTQPAITYGLRGGALVRLTVSGPDCDLHSGVYGGAIKNPIHALCELIAGMHDEGGRVMLPDFYNRVRQIDDDERIELAKLPMDEQYFLRATGAPALYGESGFTSYERTCVRPTVEITNVEISGSGGVSVVPASASAVILMRLVPDQDPEECYRSLTEYLQACGESAVRCDASYMAGGRAILVDREHSGIKAMHRALETTWGKDPAYVREGGSIAAVSLLQEELEAITVLAGFGLPDDNIHGANERLHLPTWRRGIEAMIRFFDDAGST